VTANTALADILDRGAASTEPDRLLSALVDHGVFVPVRENGAVMFVQSEGKGPALPAFASEAACARLMPEAARAVHCDALRLLDIAGKTEVGVMVLLSGDNSATVPMGLLQQALRRGRQAAGERLKLSWSTHPVAVALRDAAARRVREFPAIRTVWVSHARWLDSGVETLLVHVAVDEEIPSESAQRMMEVLSTEEAVFGEGGPNVGMIALNIVTHAETVRELEGMGLDTVRCDHATGRVDVVSREYDTPEVREAARRHADGAGDAGGAGADGAQS
jgi:hypothetical protein